MWNIRQPTLAITSAASVMFLRTASAQAHAFGARYDLPLPLEFYLAGAGAAVAFSFLIMVFFFRVRPARTRQPRIDLLRFGPMHVLFYPGVTGVVQAVSVGLFFLVLVAGFFGTQDALKNIEPTFIWIIWWVGLAYVAALVGNLWPAINPWSIVFARFERLVRLWGPRVRLSLDLAYPSWLRVWPAVALFGLFAWLELIYEAAEVPYALATCVLIYSGFTWFGMVLFGRNVWLAHGEAFSLAFGVFGRFAPFAGPERDSPDGPPSHWYLRPYAAGLVVERPCHTSMTVFVLLMLSTVTFDGLKETPLWGGLLQWIASEPSFHPLLLRFRELGFDLVSVVETFMLAFFPILFFLVHLGVSWLARYASGSKRPVLEIAGFFVFSLIPIAIAYHLAHYLSYLMLAGQRVISTLR